MFGVTNHWPPSFFSRRNIWVNCSFYIMFSFFLYWSNREGFSFYMILFLTATILWFLARNGCWLDLNSISCFFDEYWTKVLKRCNFLIFSETFIPFHKVLQSFIEFCAGSRTNIFFNRFSKLFKLFSNRLRRFNFRSLVISNFTTGQTNIYLINAIVLIDGRLCNLLRLWLWTWMDCIIEGIF